MHRLAHAVWVLGLLLAGGCAYNPRVEPATPGASSEHALCRAVSGEALVRTELFFGLSKPDGTEVGEEEFQEFADAEITPRFPDGLTLLTGDGQFKSSSGILVREESKLLILLYAFNKDVSGSVEEIRDAYKRQFQQQSVLRVDQRSCASF